jgi:LppX_LprAFG lipoprotein
MRRFAFALPFLAVPLAAAACGGSKTASTSTASATGDPLVAVKDAAHKTEQAGSEHMKVAGRAAASGQTVTFTGSGDFDSKARQGTMHVDFSAGGLNGGVDAISDGTVVYAKSDLLAIALPVGKTWLKIDLAKAPASKGVGISTFLSQDPAQALTRLLGLRGVTRVGSAQVDGSATTRYHARVDLSKLSGAAATPGTGTYDVWVGDDGYVHRVKAIVASGGTTSTVTTDLSDFGEKVSVTVPAVAETFDGTNATIPGLGG